MILRILFFSLGRCVAALSNVLSNDIPPRGPRSVFVFEEDPRRVFNSRQDVNRFFSSLQQGIFAEEEHKIQT